MAKSLLTARLSYDRTRPDRIPDDFSRIGPGLLAVRVLMLYHQSLPPPFSGEVKALPPRFTPTSELSPGSNGILFFLRVEQQDN
jgi:hypothetical protein